MVELECERCGELFDSRAGAVRCHGCRGKRKAADPRPNGRREELRDSYAYMQQGESFRLSAGLRMMSGGRD